MRRIKHMLGVTLLEIMLVLAIAAMVIVMSIRYYQTATSSEQANAILGQISAVVAAADGLSQATGGYATVSTANVTAIVGSNNMITPNGGAITVAATSTTFTVTVTTLPVAVCTQVSARLLANPHFTVGTACPAGTGTAAWTYTNQI